MVVYRHVGDDARNSIVDEWYYWALMNIKCYVVTGWQLFCFGLMVNRGLPV